MSFVCGLLLLLAALVASGCESNGAAADAALDASPDAGSPGTDAGPPCAVVNVVTAEAPQAWGVAVDGDHVYFTSMTEGGMVARVPKAGGAPETIALAQAEPARLAVFEGRVYWTNAGDGTVATAPV